MGQLIPRYFLYTKCFKIQEKQKLWAHGNIRGSSRVSLQIGQMHNSRRNSMREHSRRSSAPTRDEDDRKRQETTNELFLFKILQFLGNDKGTFSVTKCACVSPKNPCKNPWTLHICLIGVNKPPFLFSFFRVSSEFLQSFFRVP